MGWHLAAAKDFLANFARLKQPNGKRPTFGQILAK
jgi:hypothetical protein